MKSKMLLILLSSLLFGVTDLTSKNYEEEIKEGIVVVEYWAHWNTDYMVKPITELENAKICRVNICDNPELQIRDYIIVLPTIIFYDNGKQYKRLEADLSFTLQTTKEELQTIINERLLGDK